MRSAAISALESDPFAAPVRPPSSAASESIAPAPTSRASRSKNNTAAAPSTCGRALSASSCGLPTARDTSTSAMRATGADTGWMSGLAIAAPSRRTRRTRRARSHGSVKRTVMVVAWTGTFGMKRVVGSRSVSGSRVERKWSATTPTAMAPAATR